MIEQHFTLTVFLHGRDVRHREKLHDSFTTNDHANFPEVPKVDYKHFKKLRIGNCANRTSIIDVGQYCAYCQTLKLPYSIKPPNNRAIAGIGRTRKAVGLVVIHVPFKDLDLVIDDAFRFIKEDIPTILSMKDMMQNSLDICTQGQ